MSLKQKRWMVVLLVFGLVLSSAWLTSTPVPVEATTLEELEAERAETEAKLAKAKQQLKEAQATENQISAELNALYADEKVKKDEYDELVQQLEAAKKRLETAVKAYEDAVANVAKQQKAYEDRISALFKVRHKSTMEVLLSSKSISAFFSNMQLMNYINKTDYEALQSLKAAQEVKEVMRQNAEKTREDYDEFVKVKKEQLKKVQKGISLNQQLQAETQLKISSRTTDVNNLQGHMDSTNNVIESMKAENARLAEQARLQAEATARQQASIEATQSNSNQASGGGSSSSSGASSSSGDSSSSGSSYTGGGVDGGTSMIWPIPTNTYISSYFGWRPDPFGSGTSQFHWGLDFPDDPGTPIVAAQSGVVGIADAPLNGSTYGWANWGYGNYVTITNKDGIICLYAHLKDMWVSVGQYVQQGEVIGTVGSTGASTAPHLHFQVMVPWSSDKGVDPLPFLKGRN